MFTFLPAPVCGSDGASIVKISLIRGEIPVGDLQKIKITKLRRSGIFTFLPAPVCGSERASIEKISLIRGDIPVGNLQKIKSQSSVGAACLHFYNI